MSTHSGVLLLLSLASLQEGLSVPSTAQRPGVQDAIGVAVATHQRTKRCACNNRLDSECYYFCHLDITWINTPGKTALYGLGNPAAFYRRGRSVAAAATSRCSCSRAADRTCSLFCVHSLNIQTLGGSQKRPQPSLLSVLRGLADKVKDAVNPDTDNTFDDSETNVG